MNPIRTFPAEVVSITESTIWLNIDLGFNVWKVHGFPTEKGDKQRFKPSDSLQIEVVASGRRKTQRLLLTKINHV